ncbi:MAG: hypothetical protein JNL11_07885 [Bdellovibrionaceae bacterium]|nr:hypothetical protein [Pseudobdellovibrionaceae bacterium]
MGLKSLNFLQEDIHLSIKCWCVLICGLLLNINFSYAESDRQTISRYRDYEVILVAGFGNEIYRSNYFSDMKHVLENVFRLPRQQTPFLQIHLLIQMSRFSCYWSSIFVLRKKILIARLF